MRSGGRPGRRVSGRRGRSQNIERKGGELEPYFTRRTSVNGVGKLTGGYSFTARLLQSQHLAGLGRRTEDSEMRTSRSCMTFHRPNRLHPPKMLLVGLLLLLWCDTVSAVPLITITDLVEGGLKVTYDPADAFGAAQIDQNAETAVIRGPIPQNLVSPNGPIPRATFAAVVLLEGADGLISDTVTIDISSSGDVTNFRLNFNSDVEGQPALTNPVQDPRHRNELVEKGTAQDISALFVQSQDPMPILDISPVFIIKVQSDIREPASLFLLGSGLIVLILSARLRKVSVLAPGKILFILVCMGFAHRF